MKLRLDYTLLKFYVKKFVYKKFKLLEDIITTLKDEHKEYLDTFYALL